MSEIKVAHKGGDSKRMPTTGKNAGHPMQTPGAAAGGTKTGTMSWGGRKK